MKSPYVSELQPNQIVTATFLVQNKDIRQKRTGEPYLSLLLADRTGEVDGKMWDNAAEVMETFERDDFVRVRGLLQVHQNRLQITIHKMQRVSADEIDVADYFPASQNNPDEMLAELRGAIASIGNPHLKGLLENIFADPEISQRYKIAPAAKVIHHAYLGGLIEHVLSVCALARMAAAHYKCIDLDLLLSGAILHDIGKIYELTYDRSFSYSDDGQLLGHIIIGLRIISDKLRDLPAFPPRLRMLLEHMILSHHGELEYGSPKVPVFAEAMLLHHLDNLDSKMECIRASIDRDRQVDGNWTGYVSSLDRVILKKAKYLEQDGAPSQASSGAVVNPPPRPKPPAPPRTEPPKPQTSQFGEKLQLALRKETT